MERKPYQRYEELFKLEVLVYYYEHGMDRKITLEEFKIDHSCLRDWLVRYGSHENVLNLLRKNKADTSMKYKKLPKSAEEAQLEYERLQAELEKEKLRSAAFSKMIDIAETEFKLPIRKKLGAKQ